jgi:hypothetical protein
MAKDTEKTNEEIVTNDKIPFATRARTLWNKNKNKLFWFGVGAITGAGGLAGAALMLEPAEKPQYEGDNEPTVAIDTTSEAVPS